MKIFFIGIGGVSMNGLAHISLDKGHIVYGSDMADSEAVRKLKENGAVIYNNHNSNNITEDIDLVVYTAAVKEDNPEYIKAKELGIKMKNRAEFLGEVMDNYENPISVAGTHGKTSTTSMLSTVFAYSNCDPTILVGGNLNLIKGNVKIGQSKHFITEACEYTNSFLNFNSKIGIVLNVEADHLDYFSGLDEIIESFNSFGKLISEDGFFIINGDDENTKTIDKDVKATVIRFGKKETNDVVINIHSYDDRGCGEFSLSYHGKDLGIFKLSVPGEHNIYNSTSAIMASLVSGIELEDVRTNISLYSGVGRRFEHKGYLDNGVRVIDDYAHHPTEIKTTLKAVSNMTKGRVWSIFQPHTYSRTQTLLKEFGMAFENADVVIIPDIYASREAFTDEISSKHLVDEIISNNTNPNKAIEYIPTFDEVVEYIKANVKEDDIILTMGAGDVYKIAETIVVK